MNQALLYGVSKNFSFVANTKHSCWICAIRQLDYTFGFIFSSLHLDHDKPEIFLSAVSSGKYLLEGDNATLICNTSAIPHPTISWYKNGQLISNTSYLSLNNISRQDTGKYVCKTKNEDSVLANWKYLLVDCKHSSILLKKF